MDVLENLAQWYTEQCNDEWEHSYGITIESCDNPGWWVKIDLLHTTLTGRSFVEVVKGDVIGNNDPQPPWLHCYVEDNVWNGSGDPNQLTEILTVFLQWANGA